MDSPSPAVSSLEHEEQPPVLAQVNRQVDGIEEEEVIDLATMDATETQVIGCPADPQQPTALCFEQPLNDPVIHKLVTDAVERLRSHESQLISEIMEAWLRDLVMIREEGFKKYREAVYDDLSNKLKEQSYNCYIAARLEFGTATRKSDTQCKIAERQDLETLRIKLDFACEKTCEDMRELCIALAGGNENPITREVIDKAECISFERFKNLGRHAVDGVNVNIENGLNKVYEMEVTLAKDIVNRNLEMIQTAKKRAALLEQEADDRFIEKLSQTEQKTRKVKRKKEVEVPSHISTNSTRPSDDAGTPKDMRVLATRRRVLHGLGREWRPGTSQQGEYVGVGVELAPLEEQVAQQAQQHEDPRVHKQSNLRDVEANQEREQGEQEADQELDQGGQDAGQEREQREHEANQEREQGEQEADQELDQGGQDAGQECEQREHKANQRCEQGEQEAANESCDVEQRRQNQAMTESSQKFALSHSMLAKARQTLHGFRQEDNCNSTQRAVGPTGVQDPAGDADESDSDPEEWEDAEDKEAADLGQCQPEQSTMADGRHEAMDTEPSVVINDSNPSAEDRDIVVIDAGTSAGSEHQEGRVWQALAKIADAVDRNNMLIETLLDRTVHPQPGVTTLSPTRQDSGPLLRTTGRFRVPVRPAISTSLEKKVKKKMLDMRKAIREHANTMMGRNRHDKPEPAHEEAINKYKSTGNVEDGPTKTQFQPDFSETRAEKSLWNIRLSEIFENDYVQQHLPVVEVKDVAKYFLTYIHSLQTSHRKLTTTTNISGRTAYEELSKRIRHEKRKQNRFLHQLDALRYYQLHRFIGPLTEMSYRTLSDDESDHENGAYLGRSRYAIVKEAWRSEELIKWLRTIDLLAFGEKWGGRNVAQRGNGRRIRIHSTRSKDGVAVSGLPENCYDRGWLNSLNDCERSSLNMQPPLDMRFSEDERLQAARYIPLAEGEALLSNPNTNITGSDLDAWLLHMFGKATQTRT